MLKANAAAHKKAVAGGSSSSSSHVTSPPPLTPTTSVNRIALLDLTATSSSDQSGQDTFIHNSPEINSIRSSPFLIVDVWSDNLRDVFEKIMWIVEDFPYIAMDTEFPGIVARPVVGKNLQAYHYQTIKLNVDLLKLIQLGLCFCNAEGEISKGLPGMFPPPPSNQAANPTTQAAASAQPGGIVYQFHFKFNLNEDMFAQDSIDMLSASGIDFGRHAAQGIEVAEFAELLITSGIVLNEEIRWLTFHSGFDFAYLLHLLIGGGTGSGSDSTVPSLPANEQDFFELVSIYFPCIYDIKALCKHLPSKAPSPSAPNPASLQHGGLQKTANELKIGRIGQQHQAGSDALLTAAVFFKVRELFFKEIVPPTVSQLQQTAAAASAAILNGSDDTKDKEKDSRDRERDAYVAATDSTQALLTSFQQEEEKYLGELYGLQSLANVLLKQVREKERAQTGGIFIEDAPTSTTASSTATSKESTRSNSISTARGPDRSPNTFTPASAF